MHVDDLNEAIREAIRALGGMKAVGSALKGRDYSPTDAGRWLADCLNPDRRFRLTPEQLAYIRREARKIGCHVLAAYEAREAGYAPPQPIAPPDEAAELMRNFIEAAKVLQQIHDKLGDTSTAATLRAVA